MKQENARKLRNKMPLRHFSFCLQVAIYLLWCNIKHTTQKVHMKCLQEYVNIRASTHNLLYRRTAGGEQSGRWIKKGGCCWTIGNADSQQLRAAQSVCDQPSNPSFSLPPSVPPYCCPASIPAKGEGGSVERNWPLCLS